MTQLSLFSADVAEPRPEDLGGLLAAHGQCARNGSGTRLSILLDGSWRARALLREFLVRDIPARSEAPGSDRPQQETETVLLRTERQDDLTAIAQTWSRGAVKAVPPGLVLTAGMVRIWTLAAGRQAEKGYLLGLDPHAPEMYEPLAAACSRAGIAGSVIGATAGGPAIRVVGRRRTLRLVELLGTLPPGVPDEAFPTV